uniref:Uncharacterized protein n=1 Tax=Bubo bubo TaxID=30461 RepID=A0A8C0FEK5_BUBBB
MAWPLKTLLHLCEAGKNVSVSSLRAGRAPQIKPRLCSALSEPGCTGSSPGSLQKCSNSSRHPLNQEQARGSQGVCALSRCCSSIPERLAFPGVCRSPPFCAYILPRLSHLQLFVCCFPVHCPAHPGPVNLEALGHLCHPSLGGRGEGV